MFAQINFNRAMIIQSWKLVGTLDIWKDGLHASIEPWLFNHGNQEVEGHVAAAKKGFNRAMIIQSWKLFNFSGFKYGIQRLQ